MTHANRHELLAKYKERKPIAGVFAAICTATGDVWVGRTSNIDTHQNGLWFSLRVGGYPHPALQSAWRMHGEENFRFEALDQLSPEISDLEKDGELKRRAKIWTARLHATAI